MFTTHSNKKNHRIKFSNKNLENISLSIVRKAISIKTCISRIGSISSISRVGSGKSISKGRVSLTLLLASLSSLNSSEMFSLGSSNFRGVLRGLQGLRVEGRGNKGLRVEGGGNSIINRSNREPGVLGSEAKSISNIGNLLELAISINIGVASTDSTIGVANLLLDRVEVSIAIVEVSKFILSMELAASRVRDIRSNSGIAGNWGRSNSGNRGNRSRG